jgi:hypothetical protein
MMPQQTRPQASNAGKTTVCSQFKKWLRCCRSTCPGYTDTRAKGPGGDYRATDLGSTGGSVRMKYWPGSNVTAKAKMALDSKATLLDNTEPVKRAVEGTSSSHEFSSSLALDA